MDVRQLVGRNVRRRRLALGLTQEQFATASGFAQQYLSDLERGRRNPTVLTLHEVASALGLKPSALLLDEEGAAGDAQGSRLGQASPEGRIDGAA